MTDKLGMPVTNATTATGVEAPAAQSWERYLDLSKVPFTAPFTRLFLKPGTYGLNLYRAAYEVPLAASAVLTELRIVGPNYQIVAPIQVRPQGIFYGDGARLCLDGFGSLHVLLPPKHRLAYTSHPDNGGICYYANAEPGMTGWKHVEVRPDQDGPGPRRGKSFAEIAEEHNAALEQWLQKCPVVDDIWQDLVTFCWWVLGCNTLRLREKTAKEIGGGAEAIVSAEASLTNAQSDVSWRAVIPAKYGYVGLWQWDAYFISCGLRHGDWELAREQLDLAFLAPTPSGQLPDVLHEQGVLSSSLDLPAADLERLWQDRSPAVARDDVPLTKPPLAAWAIEKVLELAPGKPQYQVALDRWLPVVLASQDWWHSPAQTGADGVPKYAHPYSSGLDDCPIFAHELPVISPDLLTYLTVQDRILARLCGESEGFSGRAAELESRAAQTREMLLDLWNDQRAMFQAATASKRLEERTIVSLLPLLLADLPARISAKIQADMANPARFAQPFPLPTVAADDPAFQRQRMWRGPVWVNTNYLLCEGLKLQGQVEAARQLATRTLELVQAAAVPAEYYDAVTGAPPPGAVPAFSWTAALCIDLAVGLSRRKGALTDSPGKSY